LRPTLFARLSHPLASQKAMDRTILNLLSLIIGGSGIFVVLTKFNVPELNMSFLGENPFAIKRDAIDNVMTWIFTKVSGYRSSSLR
jgi:hypothetical protein